MKLHVSIVLVLMTVPTYAVDERFLGGGFDGQALARLITYAAPPAATDRFHGGAHDGDSVARLITYAAPPAATDRFHGGARDGHSANRLILYTAPASTLARFRGGARDGHAGYDLILSDPAAGTVRFRGGSFDGFDAASAGPYLNPLDRDTDGDDLPDWWELPAFNTLTGAVPGIDQDGDGILTRLEYTADTNPNNIDSFWRIVSISASNNVEVSFVSSPIRAYSLEYATNLPAAAWIPSPGQTNRPGVGGLDSFTDAATNGRSYRVRVFGP